VQENARPDIKVVVMTAFDDDKDLKKAFPSPEKDGSWKNLSTLQTSVLQPEGTPSDSSVETRWLTKV